MTLLRRNEQAYAVSQHFCSCEETNVSLSSHSNERAILLGLLILAGYGLLWGCINNLQKFRKRFLWKHKKGQFIHSLIESSSTGFPEFEPLNAASGGLACLNDSFFNAFSLAFSLIHLFSTYRDLFDNAFSWIAPLQTKWYNPREKHYQDVADWLRKTSND